MNIIKIASEFIDDKIKKNGAQYNTFAIVFLFNHFIVVFYEIYLNENISIVSFRITSLLLCLILLLKDKWPENLKQYSPLYWYIAISHVPIITTLLLLEHQFSLEYLINYNIGVMVVLLVVDWLSFLIIQILGSGVGLLIFYLSGNVIAHIPSDKNLILFFYMFICIFIFNSIFARNNEKFHEEKLNTIKMLSGAIAHEMRTPLASISSLSNILKKTLPVLCKAYESIRTTDPDFEKIHTIKTLKNMPEILQNVTNSAFIFIDMLLVKLKGNSVTNSELQELSILNIVEKAIDAYPLDKGDKKLIELNKTIDFKFKGNQLLIIHVFFNLLKNALYYVKAANKGNITIWAENSDKINKLYFKDTGKGISKKIAANLFNKFVTDTKYGTGIGLAFCKDVMRNLGGDIKCNSVEGEYAEFILEFPNQYNNKGE